jgi:hypothetical protein
MHGEMINGKKVIEDPAYLDIEVKGIVLDLLETVKSQGKVVGKAFEFQPPQPRLPDIREERLLSNLFSVVEYPSIIFSGNTLIRKDAEVFWTLGNSVEGHPFLLRNKRIYVFDNLRKPSSLFSKVISKDGITEEKTTNWLEDASRKDDLKRLLNISLKIYCEKTRGLFFDRDHSRFVCLLRNGKNNTFSWRSESRLSRRVVAKRICGKNGDLLFCVHYAADLRFVSIGKKIFLKIEPTMVFTYDGYEPIRSMKLARLMSLYLSKQYNNAYLGQVRFWAKYLSRLDIFITIPSGEQMIKVNVNPASAPIHFGIADEDKIVIKRKKGRRVGE